MTDAPVTQAEDGYPGSAVAAAAIATFCFPVISLIAALLLLSQQRNERRRAMLRTWVWASAAWIVLQILFVILLFAAVSGGSVGEPVPVGL
jgi:hypothetical protein